MNDSAVEVGESSGAVLDNLVHAGQRISQRMEEAVRPYGLSLTKLSVLHVLVQKAGPIPLGSLSRELHCVKSNITQVIDRMEADHLVRRVSDPEDRRSMRAEVTDEGRRRYSEAWEALQEARRAVLAGLSQNDLRQLGALVERLGSSGPA